MIVFIQRYIEGNSTNCPRGWCSERNYPWVSEDVLKCKSLYWYAVFVSYAVRKGQVCCSLFVQNRINKCCDRANVFTFYIVSCFVYFSVQFNDTGSITKYVSEKLNLRYKTTRWLRPFPVIIICKQRTLKLWNKIMLSTDSLLFYVYQTVNGTVLSKTHF